MLIFISHISELLYLATDGAKHGTLLATFLILSIKYQKKKIRKLNQFFSGQRQNY